MGNLQTGRDARPVGNHVPKEESGRRAISCPLTGLECCARYDDLIDGSGTREAARGAGCVISKNILSCILFRVLRSAAESRSV